MVFLTAITNSFFKGKFSTPASLRCKKERKKKMRSQWVQGNILNRSWSDEVMLDKLDTGCHTELMKAH